MTDKHPDKATDQEFQKVVRRFLETPPKPHKQSSATGSASRKPKQTKAKSPR